ncbi:hypothetical protein MNBD_GAMMA02-444 [hydrothermal vent metagenome]|uniref:Uncharacterized protein n=1 Tax=hydrothermal vent metagenome TaxID=652676 RepID=A0A3B0W8C3_9ZZZZ
MSYELEFIDKSLKEWNKLGACPRIEVVARNSWFESVFSLI